MMKLATRGALAAVLSVVLVSGSHAQISADLAQKAPEAATIDAIAGEKR